MSVYAAYPDGLLGTDIFHDVSICDSEGVLSIHLVDGSEREVTVRFGDYLVYRKLDEGDALRTLTVSAGTPRSTIKTVTGSDFLAWFHAESYGIREDEGLMHFSVWTIDNIIDVIALSPPEILRAGPPGSGSPVGTSD